MDRIAEATESHSDRESGRVIVGECVEVMKGMGKNVAQLVLADPPYNMGTDAALRRPDGTELGGVGDADWDKIGSVDQYRNFCREWLSAARTVLDKKGSLIVFGTYHSIWITASIAIDIGFHPCGQIIWTKPNPRPNFRRRRLPLSHETIAWFSYGPKTAYHFCDQHLLGAGGMARAEWQYQPPTSTERETHPTTRKPHPTQKPTSLIRDLILMTTRPGDTVLDPFAGTGTTGQCAIENRRNVILIERDAGWADVARRRLDRSTPSMLVPSAEKKSLPSLKDMISNGALAGVAHVIDDANGQPYPLLADGKIMLPTGEATTIHRLAQERFGRTANGFDTFSVVIQNRVLKLSEVRSGRNQARLV